MTGSERIIGLDLVRSIAILLVMLGHSLVYLPGETRKFFQLDTDGVSIFFVLSGFLIGNILLKSFTFSGGKDSYFKTVARFWIFRWAKTLPSYYVVLLALVFYYTWTQQDLGSFSWKYLVFTHNFFTSELTFFNESWSLSIEEWFYLSFPLLFLVILHYGKSRLGVLPVIVLIYFSFSLFMRIYGYEISGGSLDEKEELRKIVIYRFDALSLGILLAYLQQRFPISWTKYKKLFLFPGLVLIALFEWNHSLGSVFIYPPLKLSLEAAAIALTIPWFDSKRQFRARFLNRVLTYVSTRSYALYLLNLAFIQILFLPFFLKYVPGIRAYAGVEFLCYWVFSFVFAELLYRCVEKPVIDFRNRYK